jgi:bifunctional oligoribonuclease and PAP phosphatase NrnA
MKIDWNVVCEWLAPRQKVVITSHVRPDADAIGSEVGLAELLLDLGKSVQVINTSPTPKYLQFLDPNQRVRQLGVSAEAADILVADAIVIVDTSAWSQLSDVGTVIKQSSAPRAVIDHHLSQDDLGAAVFKETDRDSTGALIAELYRSMGRHPNPAAATALFAAMATDTGWFRFPATQGSTLRIAAELLEHGASASGVYGQLYEQGTLARLKLAGRVLSRLELAGNGKLAYTWVQQSDFSELGAVGSDTEDLVNQGLTVAGCAASFIAVEQANHQVKVSFRSRSAVDVAAIAETFGGGGHRLAAGATLPGPLGAAVECAKGSMLTALSAEFPTS